MTKQIKKVLIANRGEIALRVIKTCHKLGIETVAVYSDVDKEAPYVQAASEAVSLGESTSSESYLNQAKIIAAAQRTQADAIHPGYGFLSENASFAQACQDNQITFIGPSPEAIEQMGSKTAARALMGQHDVPLIPGNNDLEQSAEAFQSAADALGYPVLLKAVAGGGGRGMRVVESSEQISDAFQSAQREALNAFADGTLYLEKYLPEVRHIEFQILGDSSGQVIHCFERECSIQRRHQKIIEETPSPALTPELRQAMGKAAVQAGLALNYLGAGTVEFVLDNQTRDFYFLEVNTRLQVEHPITEEVTGLDLVEWQIRVAQGEKLPFKQEELQQKGHAIECRLYAEDPTRNFAPATGQLLYWQPIQIDGVRYDSGVQTGSQVSIFYDPMIAKVITWGEDRFTALGKMKQALRQTISLGLTTNQQFLGEILSHPAFEEGEMTTQFIPTHFSEHSQLGSETKNELALVATLWQWHNRQTQRQLLPAVPSGWRNMPAQAQFETFGVEEQEIKVLYRALPNNSFQMTVADKTYEVELLAQESNQLVVSIDGLRRKYTLAQAQDKLYIHSQSFGAYEARILPRFPEPQQNKEQGGYAAPMPAKILKILVEAGQEVTTHTPLMVIESMKMETTLAAFSDGKVNEIFVKEGDLVEAGTVLLSVQ